MRFSTLHIVVALCTVALAWSCSSSQPVSQNHESRTFASTPQGKDRNQKASHFNKKGRSNPKDNRSTFFSGQRSSGTSTPSANTQFKNNHGPSGQKPPSDAFGKRAGSKGGSLQSDHFSKRGRRGGVGKQADSFSGPMRKRNLKSSDFFSSSANGSASGPLDDCFSSKVSGSNKAVFGRDPFSTRRSGSGAGKMGDSFGMKVGARHGKRYHMGDGFTNRGSGPSLATKGDAFSAGPAGTGRGSFRGEKRTWFWMRIKRTFNVEKKYKTKDEFTPSKKARAKMKEKRQSAPQLDLFRREVYKKQ